MPETITAAQPATQPRRFQCRHIFTDGHRCGSPCLRSEDFCFYHHTSHARRPVPTPVVQMSDMSQGEQGASPFTLPIPEDRSAIQLAIGEILNRLANNQLDPRRAGLLLYGLQIASLNLPHARPALAQTAEQPMIEDVIADPDLGTVAPRSELLPPDAPRPNSLIARLLEDLHRGADHPSPAQPEQPTTLPTLQASAAPTTGWPILSSLTGKGGFRSRDAPIRRRKRKHAVISTAVERPLYLPAHRSTNRSRGTLAILTSACPNPSSSPSSTAGATAPRPTATP